DPAHHHRAVHPVDRRLPRARLRAHVPAAQLDEPRRRRDLRHLRVHGRHPERPAQLRHRGGPLQGPRRTGPRDRGEHADQAIRRGGRVLMFGFEHFTALTRRLSGSWRLAGLNLLWIAVTVVGLGVLGVGPASYAMAQDPHRWFRHGEPPPLVPTYLRYARELRWQPVL